MNFDLVPPKALVEWEKHLNKDIAEAKSKDAGADTTNERNGSCRRTRAYGQSD